MSFWFPCKSKVSFENNTLIFPSLSIGNVGQLAVDLLLYNYPFERVGYLQNEDVVPVVCNDALGGSGQIFLSAEVYQKDHVTVVQLRGPVVSQKGFGLEVLKWIQEQNFSRVILLCSSDGAKRTDQLLLQNPLQYFSNQSQNLSLPKLHSDFFFPKNSLSFTLHSALSSKDNEKLYLCLLCYCSEGVNSFEALSVVSQLPFLLDWKIPNLWKEPEAWNWLFGNETPEIIF